jgi:hypothetical protein
LCREGQKLGIFHKKSGKDGIQETKNSEKPRNIFQTTFCLCIFWDSFLIFAFFK